MNLRSEDIANLLREGMKTSTSDPLVITPGVNVKELEKQGAAAIDLRLGTWFVGLRQARMSSLSLERSEEALLSKTYYVPLGGKYFLHP
jgi:hypothetical protein